MERKRQGWQMRWSVCNSCRLQRCRQPPCAIVGKCILDLCTLLGYMAGLQIKFQNFKFDLSSIVTHSCVHAVVVLMTTRQKTYSTVHIIWHDACRSWGKTSSGADRTPIGPRRREIYFSIRPMEKVGIWLRTGSAVLSDKGSKTLTHAVQRTSDANPSSSNVLSWRRCSQFWL